MSSSAQSAAPDPPEKGAVPAQRLLQQSRRQRRLERYDRVMDLYGQGYSKKAISRKPGIETKTIRRWLAACRSIS